MSDLQAQDQVNPFAKVVEPELGTAETITETSEQEHETAHEPEAAPVDTADSILSALLTDLEGLAHMAKTEVEAIVAVAREKFNKL